MSLPKVSWTKALVVGWLLLLGWQIARHWGSTSAPAGRFRMAAVRSGDLLATVSATGTIEPEEVVDVGAQVVGMIETFGRDPTDPSRPVDYLSAVEEGTVLARIDDTVYRARVDRAAALVEQAQAQVEQAQANVRRAEADVQQMKAKTYQADRDWRRAQKLSPTRVISEMDYDTAQALFEIATANLAVSEAALDQARASKALAERGLLVARADHREAQKNLDYTVIRSPVKGVIIDRRVNVGQTVVSSLNAPSLFLIAKDLRRLQVWASVNEADVGRLRRGQAVRFSVDAYPDEVFPGRVSQVRLNATMTQNVVTYTVVVDTDNAGGKLLPYLTANLKFEVGERRNVLLVPNAALRWQPQPRQVAPDARQPPSQANGHGRSADGSGNQGPGEKKTQDRGLVWVEDRGFVRPVEVRLGLSDGLLTELTTGALVAGQRVVVGEELPAEAAEASSPFAPQPFGGRR